MEPDKTEKTEFPVIHIGGQDIMVDTAFYKWLQDNEYNTFHVALHAFYPGFHIKDSYITADQLEAHKAVFDHFWFNKLNKLNK